MARKKKRSTYLLTEPNWKELALLTEEEDRKSAYKTCEYFVHYEIKSKKAQEAYKAWIKKESGWTKDEIKYSLSIDNGYFTAMGKTVFIAKKLGYWLERHVDYINETQKPHFVKIGKKAYKDKQAKKEIMANKKTYTIQERMSEQVSPLCGEWEGQMDNFVEKEYFDLEQFDPFNDMRAYTPAIKPAHAKIIKESFQGQYEEAIEVKEWKCPDLKEGYSHFTANMRKDFLKFYEKINNACDTLIETGKAKRKPRKPKPINREKMVSKLKYQINCSDLGIASINPLDIIDAQQVWVYNTKTRKIGVYFKDNLSSGLMVRGTSIKDFDAVKSVQKTLRKPAEQLKMFKIGTKTKFMSAFDDIRATEIKLNGRVNDQIIILKAF